MTGGSSFSYLQKAVYGMLTADAMLMAQVTGIFDFVPDNQAFPYVSIGEFTSAPFETFDRYGQEVTMTVHVWSQRIEPNAYQGMRQIELIMDSIQRILVRAEIAVEHWGVVGIWGDFSQTMLDYDGITRHGILRYRIKTLQDYPTYLGGD